jgi:ubiquinone/menaquinone biosynthesis C-methylase UbiE
MEKARLYDATTANVSLEDELRRLYNQANGSKAKEKRVLAQFGLTDGMSVLEVASGPGFVTEWLSEMVPNGSITGVEIDPVLIRRAERYLEGKARCPYRILNGSVMGMDIPDDTFDFAFARLIFVHLEDMRGAAREILRVLKPGGRLVISETDFSLNHITDPHLVESQPLMEKLLRYQSSRGRSALAGRRLWRVLDSAGFQKLDLEAVAAHSGEMGMEWFYPQISPDRIMPLVEAGVLSRDEAEDYRAAIEKFMASEDPFYMRILLMAAGEKPR